MTVNYYELLAQENSFSEIIANRARQLGDAPAIIFKDRTYSYDELKKAAETLAASFLQLGISRGDRIALILPTAPEFLLSWLAASRIGACIVGLNVRYRENELVYMINNAQPATLICVNNFGGVDFSKLLTPLLPKLPSLKRFIFVGETDFPGAIPFVSLLESAGEGKLTPLPETSSGEENFIIYTSGSTGVPKGAVLTEKSILAMIRPWAKNIALRPEDRLLCFLPLNHVGGGTICALTTLFSGAALILHDVFSPAEALQIATAQKATVMGGVPTVFALLLTIPGIDKLPLPEFRLLIYGGAAAPPELLKKMRETFRCAVMGCYGSTEVSGFCTYTSLGDGFEKILTTVGRAPEGVQLKIVDQNRNTVSPGKVGEVAVKGDLLFREYLGLPRETAEVLADGWFYTGDLGYLDEEGYLTIVGRLKDMYITGGFNVYPLEIENLLETHPGVAMASVLGVPDEIKGEVGVAAIVKKPGVALTEEEIKQFLSAQLADYKVPSKIVFMDSLPMTPLGKINKPTIRQKLSAERLA